MNDKIKEVVCRIAFLKIDDEWEIISPFIDIGAALSIIYKSQKDDIKQGIKIKYAIYVYESDNLNDIIDTIEI